MKLHTQCYLPQPSREAVDPSIGLLDLQKGLNSILLGYLVSLGAILAAGGLVWLLIVQAEGATLSRKILEEASTILFAVVLFLGLAGLGSYILIVRGKWRCLTSAPERFHAKWMMFLSILCIVAGPLLNAGGSLVGNSKPNGQRKPSAWGRADKMPSLTGLRRELESSENWVPELDTRTYIKLAGKGIGLFSGVFFVLFLRAVALSWGAVVRARLAELYLVFEALLVFGVFVLLRNPDYMLARPRLLLSLGAGWLIAGLWYLGLILSMSAGITSILARQPRPLEEVPAAPTTSSLPPLPEMRT